MYTRILLITLLTTRFALAQWLYVGSVSGVGYGLSISVPGENVVVIAGGYPDLPTVFLSTNGGANFSSLSTSGIQYELMTVWAMNKDTIFVGDAGNVKGGNAKAYRTYNGGATSWTSILSPGGSYSFFDGIVFTRPDQRFGIALSDPPNGGGHPFYLAKTTDYGATWIIGSTPVVPSNLGALQNPVYCIDSLFYGFGIFGGPPRLMITTNGGSSWNLRYLPASGSGVSSIAFSTDKLRGVAAVYSSTSGSVHRTTDGGLNWVQTSIGTGVSGYFNLKWIYGTDIVYLTGTIGPGGVVKRSSDGGFTWTQMSTSGDTNISHFEYFKASAYSAYLYAVTREGYVLRYVDNNLLGVNPVSNNIPSEFKLYQNYPNPFNPLTKIKFDIPENLKSEICNLKLFDLLGHEITTLVNEHLSPGTYEIEWNVTQFPSGVYFYQLTAENFTDTKKLIIIK